MYEPITLKQAIEINQPHMTASEKLCLKVQEQHHERHVTSGDIDPLYAGVQTATGAALRYRREERRHEMLRLLAYGEPMQVEWDKEAGLPRMKPAKPPLKFELDNDIMPMKMLMPKMNWAKTFWFND